MKQGKSLVELATEIQRQEKAKQDFVVDTRELDFNAKNNVLVIPGHGNHRLSDHAHGQIAARTGIPKPYYDRMRSEAPELLDRNVTNWFQNEPERRMIRTLDGHARAFLSDRYRVIDNEQILYQTLPALQENGMQILSNQVTESNLYLQARFPRLEGEVKVGDVVQMGLVLRNSEVGLGALDISPMVYRLICTNGMVSNTIANSGRLRKTHVGGKVLGGDDNIVYSDDTREALDKALMLQIRDAIKQLSDPELFQRLILDMQRAANTEPAAQPVKVVEEVAKQYSINKTEKDRILENFLADGDRTLWGLANAVTKTANNHDSYDRAVELEALGGRVMSMTSGHWNELAKAA